MGSTDPKGNGDPLAHQMNYPLIKFTTTLAHLIITPTKPRAMKNRISGSATAQERKNAGQPTSN